MLGATTAQDVYCISMPGATVRKGYCRIHEICTVRWAEFFADGSRRGAIPLHGHDAATSQKSVSTPLHPSHLPTRSPFGSGMQSSCQEDGMKPAHAMLGAGMLPSWEKSSAKLEGRVRREEKKSHLVHFLCSSSSCARCIGHGPVSCI